MKKYLYVFKSNVMSNLQYITNIISGFLGYFIHIFIFINLWKYIYSDPNELINGYNVNQTIWYVILTEVLWCVTKGRALARKISDDVKEGNIAYNINKPYNYVGYALSNHLGECFLSFILYSILGGLIGLIFLGSFPKLTILNVLLLLLTMILAMVINTLIVIAIGLFSFVVEDSSPLFWLYSKLILVVGTIFPIEFFPASIRPIISYSPVYVVCYGPAKLFVDFNYSLCGKVIIAQVIYLFIAFAICSLIYRKGVKNLNVNGG